VSQGQSRERSEREIYIYFCAGLREFRNKHLKRLRFSLRSLNQRRINMGLTGWTLFVFVASVSVLLLYYVGYHHGKFVSKVCVFCLALSALLWQYGYSAWLSLYSELPQGLREQFRETFQSPHFADD